MTRVIGPPRSRRRRWWLAGTTVGVAVIVAVFFVAGSGAIVTGSPSSFESSDGNMTVETNGHTDWNCFAGHDGFTSTASLGGHTCNTSLNYSNAVDLAGDPNGEAIWKPGQKLDTDCAVLKNPGNTPNKDDFTYVASYNDLDASNNTYLYGANTRLVANGNSSGNLELNQTTGSSSCPISRTAGDRLLAFDFLNGGTNLDFHALTWITPDKPNLGGNNGSCDIGNDNPPCWGANVISSSSGITVGGCGTTGNDVEGCAAQSAIAGSANGISGNDLVANQFSEFGVNLTKVLGLTGCVSFPQEVWESRSSGSSFTSNPEDIEIEQHTINNCGEIHIIKHSDPPRLNQDFSFTTTGGLNPSSFTLNDSARTSDAGPDVSCSSTVTLCNKQDYTNVSSGTYTVTEGGDPTGFAFDSVSCTGGTTSTSGKTVTITLAPSDVVTCTYVNKQQLWAIKVSKTSIKGTALKGATFSVTGPNSFSTTLTSGDDGTACVDQLPFGTYSVKETAAPDGYNINDSAAHDVAVNVNTSCSGTPQSLSFADTPKADLTVTLTSEATGGTKGSITCKDSSGTNIGDSPQPSTGTAESATVTANGLTPKSDGSAATYTCTVLVDP